MMEMTGSVARIVLLLCRGLFYDLTRLTSGHQQVTTIRLLLCLLVTSLTRWT